VVRYPESVGHTHRNPLAKTTRLKNKSRISFHEKPWAETGKPAKAALFWGGILSLMADNTKSVGREREKTNTSRRTRRRAHTAVDLPLWKLSFGTMYFFRYLV